MRKGTVGSAAVILAIGAIIATAIAGCGRNEPAKGPAASPVREKSGAPAVPAERSVETPVVALLPAEPRSDQAVRVVFLRPVPGASVTWYVNDMSISDVEGNELRPGHYRKGDRVRVDVRSADGSVVSSPEVVVLNSAPRVAEAALVPKHTEGEEFLVSLQTSAVDQDDDRVEFRVAWSVNGTPFESDSGERIRVKKGDRITARVTPFDGEAEGLWVSVSTVVRSVPPRLGKRLEDLRIADGVLSATVTVNEGAGECARYEVVDGPEGLGIDETTGRIQWKLPGEITRRVDATVRIKARCGDASSIREYPIAVDVR